MTQITETASVETAATTGFRKSVWSGVLSNIETHTLDTGNVILATLTKTIKGEIVHATISISGDAVNAVEAMIVDGATVRLYGEATPSFFRVIGPDLTARTLARQAKTTDAVSETPKTKKPRTPAQIAAWETFRARFRTKKVAEPTAA